MSHLRIDTHEIRGYFLCLYSGEPLFPAVIDELDDEGVAHTEEDGPEKLPVSSQVFFPLIRSLRLEERELYRHGPDLSHG